MELLHDFLSQMAHQHELSKDQEEVFLLRFGNKMDYPEIAKQLNTSPAACLKRMGQVYTKFGVGGIRKGKENRLRHLLLKHLQQTTQQDSLNKPGQGESAVPNAFSTVVESVSSKKVAEAAPNRTVSLVQHNLHLHPQECSSFIGRQPELARLMELLAFKHSAHLISIDGIGGVGKTTLVLEAAHRCLQASIAQIDSSVPEFEAIIFTSAKQHFLTPFKPLQRRHCERTLQDIYQVIARTLEQSLAQVPTFEQPVLIQQWLSQQPTLLIIDNLETLDDQDEVLSFVYDLPAIVKVVLTTREQVLPVPIRLESLPEADGLMLLQNQIAEKEISLASNDVLSLYRKTSGIPAAIVYAVGQLAFGYSLGNVLMTIGDAAGDVARFYFGSSIEPLKGQTSHKLLMTLAIFPNPVSQEVLTRIALSIPDPILSGRELAKLQQLSLIRRKEGRYHMLPLTREYAMAELAAEPQFEQEMCERWIDWGRCLAMEYGAIDWNEWYSEYARLEEEWVNLEAVVMWCIAKDRYTDVLALWQQIKGYADVRGYWDDRLEWTEWLIASAKQRNEKSRVVELMCDRARTLVLMRRLSDLEEADNLLQQAWELRDTENFALQFEIIVNIIVLHLRGTKQIEQVERWIGKGKDLLKQPTWKSGERQRQEVQLLYYQAETTFKAGNFTRAKNLYERALKRAVKIDWKRGVSAIRNWLAEVAIEQGNLEEAQQILFQGLLVVEQNKDKRATAFYQRSLAYLSKRQGNAAQVKYWAKLSSENFESLRMISEAEDARSLIEVDS